MAWTVVLALVGSLLLTLTLIPVLASLLLKRTGHEREPRFLPHLRRLYVSALDWCLAHRKAVVAAALAVVVAGALVALTLGGIISALDEGDFPRSGDPALVRVPGSGPRYRAGRTGSHTVPRVRRSSRAPQPEWPPTWMGSTGGVFVIFKPKSECKRLSSRASCPRYGGKPLGDGSRASASPHHRSRWIHELSPGSVGHRVSSFGGISRHRQRDGSGVSVRGIRGAGTSKL